MKICYWTVIDESPHFVCDSFAPMFEARGYDSVIRRMNILVCSGMDFMCALSTFALELEDK